MPEFSSVQEMLGTLVLQKVEEYRKGLLDQNDILKMTTTWLVDEGIEITFGHEELDILFQNMQVIVNSVFFKPWKRFEQYPDAYHQLTKHRKWESIDSLVKRGLNIKVNPIAFISLVHCFTGRNSHRQTNLADVLAHLIYPSTENRLLVVLSSENEERRKTAEINDAKDSILSNFGEATIEEFNISNDGGGYYGFTSSF